VRVFDASSARIWATERSQRLVGPEANRTADLYLETSKAVADTYPTITPASTNFYLEGRKNIESYTNSFASIRDSAYGAGQTLRNARLSDAQIEAIIKRMDLAPRGP
jgi:hypothetical protein